MPTYDVTIGPGRTLAMPDELCERFGIEEGTRVEFFLTLDGQIHFHVITQAASEFGGFRLERSPPLSIREMDDAIGEHLSEKYRRAGQDLGQDRLTEPSRSAAE